MELKAGNITRNFKELDEEWLFVAPILLSSFIEFQNRPAGNWQSFLGYLVTAGISFSPVMLFKWYQSRIRQAWSGLLYRSAYGFLFLFYPLILTWLSVGWIDNLYISDGFFAIAGAGMISVEGLLWLNRFLRSSFTGSGSRFLPEVGFESSILLIIGIISLIVAFMAVSSLPVERPGQELVIELKFSLSAVSNHLFLYVWYALQFFIYFFCWYLFYYLNHYGLYHGILLNKGILPYLIALPAAVVVLYPVVGQLILWLPLTDNIPDLLPSGDGNPFNLLNGLIGLFVTAVTFPLILIRQWHQKNARISQLEQQKAETELAMLKQQVNPHFFLNTLNNLYALSLNKSDQAPEMTMRLSELMRYVLYRGNKDRVKLEDEISYIEDYLELQQMRMHQPLDLTFEKNITDPALPVPPLLLIVLVENAFKHGIEPSDRASYLSITLDTTGGRLRFVCENSLPEADQQREPGIGLENLRRQLELQFPDRHNLQVVRNTDSFKAELIIQL